MKDSHKKWIKKLDKISRYVSLSIMNYLNF